jgi:hypothetical protein
MHDQPEAWLTLVVLVIAAVGATGLAAWLVRQHMRRRRLVAALFAAIDSAVRQRFADLTRIRAETMVADPYGNWMKERWWNEVQAFVTREVISKKPWLSRLYGKRKDIVFNRVERLVQANARPDSHAALPPQDTVD